MSSSGHRPYDGDQRLPGEHRADAADAAAAAGSAKPSRSQLHAGTSDGPGRHLPPVTGRKITED
jgi:hypothetical protein